MAKFANKNKGTTRSREVPIAEQMAHYTFRRHLPANNFYLHNCVDVKPVSIIRLISQIGFRIICDSNASGFNIFEMPFPNYRQQLPNPN